MKTLAGDSRRLCFSGLKLLDSAYQNVDDACATSSLLAAGGMETDRSASYPASNLNRCKTLTRTAHYV